MQRIIIISDKLRQARGLTGKTVGNLDHVYTTSQLNSFLFPGLKKVASWQMKTNCGWKPHHVYVTSKRGAVSRRWHSHQNINRRPLPLHTKHKKIQWQVEGKKTKDEIKWLQICKIQRCWLVINNQSSIMLAFRSSIPSEDIAVY